MPPVLKLLTRCVLHRYRVVRPRCRIHFPTFSREFPGKSGKTETAEPQPVRRQHRMARPPTGLCLQPLGEILIIPVELVQVEPARHPQRVRLGPAPGGLIVEPVPVEREPRRLGPREPVRPEGRPARGPRRLPAGVLRRPVPALAGEEIGYLGSTLELGRFSPCRKLLGAIALPASKCPAATATGHC